MALPISILPLPNSIIKELIANDVCFLSDIVEMNPWSSSIDEIYLSKQINEANLLEPQKKALIDALKQYLQSVS